MYLVYLVHVIRKYIHSNLPKSVVGRLAHPRSRDNQGQEMFLSPSSDNIYIYINKDRL